jgi:hypothetical protein
MAGKRFFQEDAIQKEDGLTLLLSDKLDLKSELVRREKGHFILIKEMI